MKHLLLLPIHSVADIITNSSTELFVCATEKTKEQIEEMLNLLGQAIGEPHGVGEIKVYHGAAGLREIIDTRLDGYLPSYYGIDELVRKFVPYESWNDLHMPDFERGFDYGDYQGQERRNSAKLDEFFKVNKTLLDKHISTITVLEGVEDNSIPYELFDLLESRLNAARYHLG